MTSEVIRASRHTRLGANRIKLLVFFLSLVVIAIQFAPMLLRLHYSSDSYHLIADQHTTWYLQCGRYTFWLLACLVDHLGINLVVSQRVFIALCLPCLAASSAMIVWLFSRMCGLEEDPRSLILVMPASLMWGNVFVEDWILFPEVSAMIAIGAVTLSFSIWFALSMRGLWSALISGLFLLIALGCYQSLVGSYVAAVVIGAVISERGRLRPTVKKAAGGILVGLICAVLCVVFLKVIGQLIGDSGRGSTFSPSTILLNIRTVLVYQLRFFANADGLLFVPVMQLMELAGLLAFVCVFKRDRRRGALYLLAFLIGLAASYAPHYVEASILMSPRSNVAVWMTLACLCVALFCEGLVGAQHDEDNIQMDVARVRWRRVAFASIALLAMFVVTNTASIWDISYDVYSSNVQDRNYAQQVAKRIREYESESGVEITGLGIVGDAHVQTKYPETRYHSFELGRRIMNCSYANVEMINFVGGLNLNSLSLSDAERADLFGSRDWSALNLDEQLVFKGNEAFLALY